MKFRLPKWAAVTCGVAALMALAGLTFWAVSHLPKKKIVPPPEAPVYADPAWQARYLQWRDEYAKLFDTPPLQAKVRVKLPDGTIDVGDLKWISDTNMVIEGRSGLRAYERAQLAMDSRTQYFLKDFVHQNAVARVELERAANPEGPPPFVVPSPDDRNVSEVRYSMDDDMDIRVGPGTNYKNAADVHVLKGQKVYVLDERDGWIRFKLEPKGFRGVGWVHKFATMPADEMDFTRQDYEIRTLRNLGVLADIEPPNNEAYVDAGMWTVLDQQVQRGMSRAMAYYCGQRKGTGRGWVEIKDVESGRKLARYSESKGYMTY